MIVLCKHTVHCVYSMCSRSRIVQRRFSHSRWAQIVLDVLTLWNHRVCPQPENEEKTVVYNNIGPNVCMGDHKVTVQLHSPSLCVFLMCACVLKIIDMLIHTRLFYQLFYL